MNAKPQARIVIRHLSGSKINQVEELPLKDLQKVTIGRDPNSGIVYDQRRDDVVSRQHAAIRVESGPDLSFRLVDLNSSNGTLLNGERISGEVELVPEDLVELGAGGPKFIFDVQPRPANLAARTRVLNPTDVTATHAIGAAATAAMATAEFNRNGRGTQEVSAPVATAMRDSPDGGKSVVGKETVLRMLFQERRKSTHVLVGSIAAVVAVIAVAAGALLYYNKITAARLQEEAIRQADRARIAAEGSVTQQLGASAKEIIRKYGDSSVRIDVVWRLYDKDSGKALFHKVIYDPKTKEKYASFIRLPNGKLVRWLTLDDQERQNIAISGSGRASGFVVSENGFILTNKHVAADWMLPFRDAGTGLNNGRKVYVYSYAAKGKLRGEAVNLDSSELSDLEGWLPENGGLVFDSKAPVLVDGAQSLENRRYFQGRDDLLEVRFPGNRVSMQASLVRASNDADAALIKIEAAQSLKPVEIAQDDRLEVGDKVIVLGYPAVSPDTIARVTSVENTRISERSEFVPEPTVTEGIISLLGQPYRREGEITLMGSMGDAYQMSINSTGAGNSGGPVFNTKGQVIGLFTYQSRGKEVTFGVPIRHGRQLLNPQRSM